MRRLSINDLATITLEYTQKDYDYHINVCGQNGVGKTSFSILFAKTVLELDPSRSLRFIVSRDDVKNIKPREVVLFDEGETLLGIRDSHSKTGRIINYIKLIRYYNNIFIVNSISPIHLAKEYREHKVKLITYLFERGRGIVFGIPPTLPSSRFHEQLEEIFAKSYINIESFLDEISDVEYVIGYVDEKIDKEKITDLYTQLSLHKQSIISNYKL